jgi:hypothetical protein
MTQTTNGFDAIQSTSSSIGRIAGGILGGLIAGIFTDGIGIMAGAAGGSEIGGELFGDAGAIKQKQALLTQQYLKSRNRYNAITGLSDKESLSSSNMSGVGLNAIDFYNLQSEYARKRGYRYDSDKTTRDAVYAEKAFGLDQSTTQSLIEVLRSSRDQNRDLSTIIRGALEKGKGSLFQNGDNTFLNEFVSKLTTLQKELLKTQGTVATGTSFDILKKFNNVGGQFDARDPRSLGYIESINNSLINPNTDFKKSLSYYALREAMPGASLADILQEQQKGTASSTYMESMMKLYSSFGDDSSQRINFADFVGGNIDAGTRLLRGFKSGKLRNGGTFGTELRGLGITDQYMKSRAEQNTAPIEQITAENINQTLAGKSLQAAFDAISKALENAFGGAVISISSNNATITLKGNSAVIGKGIRQNVTKKPVADKITTAEELHQFMGYKE